MQYTKLGDTGLVVSRLAFGTMTFGVVDGPWSSVAKVDTAMAKTLVDQSLDAGVNFFDTSDSYAAGQSETMLGQALGKKRRDVVVATKVGFRHNDNLINTGLSRKYIMQCVEDSLKRLNTDYIDVYIAHRLDPFTPLEETLETFNDLVRRGMVRYIGFSNWPAWKGATAIGLQRQHGWTKFMVAQMYYSLVGRDLEHEFAPFMQDSGIGSMIWSPLAGGFLTGKYKRDAASEENPRIYNPGNEFIPFNQDHGYQVVDALGQIAAAHNASVAQIALAWLLAKPYVSTILVGASKPAQLQDNLGAIEVQLSPAEITQLDDLTTPPLSYPNWFNARTADEPITNALKPKV